MRLEQRNRTAPYVRAGIKTIFAGYRELGREPPLMPLGWLVANTEFLRNLRRREEIQQELAAWQVEPDAVLREQARRELLVEQSFVNVRINRARDEMKQTAGGSLGADMEYREELLQMTRRERQRWLDGWVVS